MSGRFARRSTQEVLADWFGVDIEDMPFFAPSYNVAPQSTQPVVRLNRDTGRREFALMRWGLVPFWAKEAKMAYSTINARAEEAASKPAYREALKKRRCLVPADAFYEWQKLDAKTKHPWAIALKSGEPYAFAGLCEHWQPKEGNPSSPPLETFTILGPSDPNEIMQPIHNRMPVILPSSDYIRWPRAIQTPLARPSIFSVPTPRKKWKPGPSATASVTSATTILNCSSPIPSKPADTFIFATI